jgi:hypothetical protein
MFCRGGKSLISGLVSRIIFDMMPIKNMHFVEMRKRFCIMHLVSDRMVTACASIVLLVCELYVNIVKHLDL